MKFTLHSLYITIKSVGVNVYESLSNISDNSLKLSTLLYLFILFMFFSSFLVKNVSYVFFNTFIIISLVILYSNHNAIFSISEFPNGISISEFLKGTELKIDELNKYLLNSQKDKEYMLFDTNTQTFKHEKPNINDYTIKSDSIELNKTKNSFIGKTESGKKITILLRWKNGNGIAFPAFQIK